MACSRASVCCGVAAYGAGPVSVDGLPGGFVAIDPQPVAKEQKTIEYKSL